MVWLDDDNVTHDECIECGEKAGEGNRCYECWIKVGKPMNWSNKDKPLLYKENE